MSAFADSPPVAEAVDTIVRELVEARSLITGVRRPAPELAASYEAHLARQTQIKGRPAVYPYVGCGLGHGPLVQLADGSVKWDMISGIGVHAFGHSDPDLVATALRAALSDTVMQGNL
ncbi:MAG: acetylornithine aminotransferase, partial [Planctomycetota bacterium]|nr:acetylornithine aminotransferase [Planctomycetota bacterium]